MMKSSPTYLFLNDREVLFSKALAGIQMYTPSTIVVMAQPYRAGDSVWLEGGGGSIELGQAHAECITVMAL